MTNPHNYVLNEQFKSECKIINLKYEYPELVGTEKWAIVTDLSNTELEIRFKEVIDCFSPYVLLTKKQNNAFTKFESNERKFRKRQTEIGDAFPYESGTSELFHTELLQDNNHIEKMLITEALDNLSKSQKRRVVLKHIYGYSCREIAKMEGVQYSAVVKSVSVAIEKLKKSLN